MTKLKLLLFSGLTLGASFVNAADLAGHTMSCSVNLDKTFGGVQQTTYQFLKAVDGSNIVLIFEQGSEDSGTSNSPYFVSGAKLAITLNASSVDEDTPVYNISNSSSIKRSFKSCVFPGEGGGDAKALCAQVEENCSLN